MVNLLSVVNFISVPNADGTLTLKITLGPQQTNIAADIIVMATSSDGKQVSGVSRSSKATYYEVTLGPANTFVAGNEYTITVIVNTYQYTNTGLGYIWMPIGAVNYSSSVKMPLPPSQYTDIQSVVVTPYPENHPDGRVRMKVYFKPQTITQTEMYAFKVKITYPGLHGEAKVSEVVGYIPSWSAVDVILGDPGDYTSRNQYSYLVEATKYRWSTGAYTFGPIQVPWNVYIDYGTTQFRGAFSGEDIIGPGTLLMTMRYASPYLLIFVTPNEDCTIVMIYGTKSGSYTNELRAGSARKGEPIKLGIPNAIARTPYYCVLYLKDLSGNLTKTSEFIAQSY
jgi:hypothetical protein